MRLLKIKLSILGDLFDGWLSPQFEQELIATQAKLSELLIQMLGPEWRNLDSSPLVEWPAESTRLHTY